jgi:hypothetical protein
MKSFFGRLNILSFAVFVIFSLLLCGTGAIESADNNERCLRWEEYRISGGDSALVVIGGRLRYGRKWDFSNLEQKKANCYQWGFDSVQNCEDQPREATAQEYAQVRTAARQRCYTNSEWPTIIISIIAFPVSLLAYIFLVNGVLRWLLTGSWRFEF